MDALNILVNFSAILISLTIHEYAHAWTANYLGDPTPGRHNRLNLNPMTIIKEHPFGALIVPLIASTQGFLIGWAATPVNPNLVNRKYTVRFAERWIALAGPLSNVILAIICALFFVLLKRFESVDPLTFQPLLHLTNALVLTNIFLAIFNMIPVAPFDGFAVLKNSMSHGSPIVRMIEEYSNIVFLFVFVFAFRVIGPLVYTLYSMLLKFFAAIIL